MASFSATVNKTVPFRFAIDSLTFGGIKSIYIFADRVREVPIRLKVQE